MKPNWIWQITPSGQFAHRKEYVEPVADVNDLEAMHYDRMDEFRYEKEIPVQGHLFVLKAIPTKRNFNFLKPNVSFYSFWVLSEIN